MANFLSSLFGGSSGATGQTEAPAAAPAPAQPDTTQNPYTKPSDVSIWDRLGLNNSAYMAINNRQGVAETNRKNVAYNALRKTYGDIAGDPERATALATSQKTSADAQKEGIFNAAVLLKDAVAKGADPVAAYKTLAPQLARVLPQAEIDSFGEHLAQNGPGVLDDVITHFGPTQSGSRSGTPAAVAEYQYFQTLDDAGKNAYINVKRADPTAKLTKIGEVPTVVLQDQRGGGFRQVPLSDLATETGGAQAVKTAEGLGTAVGKAQGEKVAADLPLSNTERAAAEGNIAGLDDQVGFVKDTIAKARDEIGPLSAGLASVTDFIPGSPASQLKESLKAAESQVLLQTLAEMKKLSSTGSSGFGALSNAEGDTLRAKWGSISRARNPAKLRDALDDFESQLDRSSDRVKKAYEDDVRARGQRGNPAPAAAGSDIDALVAKHRSK